MYVLDVCVFESYVGRFVSCACCMKARFFLLSSKEGTKEKKKKRTSGFRFEVGTNDNAVRE